MAVHIQLRRGASTDWAEVNPTLTEGEIGYENDTLKFKVGDGVADWNSLPYINVLPGLLGVANGIATLDSNGNLNPAQIPDIAKVTVHAVADQSARLALTVEPGDIAIQADTGETYVLASSPASTNGNWSLITVSDPFPTHTTDNLSEGSTNKYFTNQRAQDAVASDIATAISNAALGSTDDLSEGVTNLYFTSTRGQDAAVDAITAGTGVTKTPGSHSAEFSIGQAVGTTSNVTFNDVTVSGDLTVQGTTTTVNSTTVEVKDKNIALGNVATPTDTTANGGGITLKGATDKTLNWVSGTSSWTSSENVDLESGHTYKIAGTDVLTSTQVLGKSVPSGTIVGTSDSQTLSNKTISGSSNTLSNIANASLTNSKVTIGSTDVSLGATATNLDGVTINSTTIPSSKTLVTTSDTGSVTSTMIADGTIVNADINASAAIADTKLGTISTSGKVSNSATTATSSNTTGAIVARDSSGNFSAGTISANLTGNVTGDVTGTVSSLSNHTTDDVTEGSTNKYYTAERAQDDVFNAVTNGTGISTTYTDSSNSFSITNTGVTSLAGTSNQITASASTGGVTLSLPSTVVLPGDLEVTGNTVIDGNLQVKGTTTTVNTQTLSVEDNLIYLNAGLDLTLISATHNTTTVTYRVNGTPPVVAGMSIIVTGVTPSDYNISLADNKTVDSVNVSGGHTDIVVTKTVTVAYTSGGTVELKSSVDPDLGFAGGYYEGGYAHAGLFRDASDGKFKFFQGYTPEPDASTTIDTTDGSFALAPVSASAFYGSGANLTSIPNSALVNSTISGVSLGSNLNALTIGTGLSGTSYNGSTGVTIAIDSTVATLAGIQTLTNKTISGASNTLTNIGNSSLTNSSVTINGTSFSLGDSKTIKASTTNALTIGTGLSGTSFDGGTAVTIAIDSTVATLTGSQTLTNKTLTTPIISSISNTGTLTLPTSTDTLVGKATTDTFTNKTFDTAGTGNSFKINGTSITAVTGTGSVALAASPTFTGTVNAAAVTTSGDVTVGGNLTVSGTTTTVNSTTITVADKNIELGSVGTPTDTTANGGGITLRGATDKTLNWVSGTSSWTASENFDLASGKTYKIAGTDVLTATQVLGKAVPSGTIVGTSDSQTLTNKTLTSPVISTISNTGTLTLPTSTDTLVGRATTDTLTNKTLTSPVISTISNTGTLTLPTSTDTLVGRATTDTLTNKTLSAAVATGGITHNGSTSGTIVLQAAAIAGTNTLTLPAATDTLVGKATTDTLTNKTFDTAGTGNSFKINGTSITAVTGSGSVVLATSPTLVTPTLGVASATSVNKVAITAPATSATLTLADGSTLATSGANSITLTSTGATTVTLPTTGTLVNTAVTSLSSLATVGTITSGTWNGTAIGVTYGGNGVTSRSKGGIVVGTGSNTTTELAVGTDTYVLTADSTQSSGVKWAAAAGGGPSYVDIVMGVY